MICCFLGLLMVVRVLDTLRSLECYKIFLSSPSDIAQYQLRACLRRAECIRWNQILAGCHVAAAEQQGRCKEETMRYPATICPTSERFCEAGKHLGKHLKKNEFSQKQELKAWITHGQTWSGTRVLHINQAQTQSSPDGYVKLDRERLSNAKIWRDILVSRKNCLSRKNYVSTLV